MSEAEKTPNVVVCCSKKGLYEEFEDIQKRYHIYPSSLLGWKNPEFSKDLIPILYNALKRLFISFLLPEAIQFLVCCLLRTILLQYRKTYVILALCNWTVIDVLKLLVLVKLDGWNVRNLHFMSSCKL